MATFMSSFHSFGQKVGKNVVINIKMYMRVSIRKVKYFLAKDSEC